MARRSPPEGPPWDAPLDDAPLAFVDFEMSGLDPKRDRIIEVCVHRVSRGQVEASLSTLVSSSNLALPNTAVHGITRDMLESAPAFEQVAGELEGILEGAVFVAHAARWDVAFFEAEMARVGRAKRVPAYLDTLMLSRRAFKEPSHALATLAERLDLEHKPAHRAEADVLALRALFERVVAALAPKTPRDLWQVRVASRIVRDAVLDACREAARTGEAVQIVYRPGGRAPMLMDFVVREVRTEGDAHRILGYDKHSFARRELRAERILRIGSEDALVDT